MSVKSSELSKLWNEVCDGNQRAFSIIHSELYSKLYTSVKRIIKDEELTNDILQDTFIKLWVNKDSVRKVENVNAYFFTAARNMSINYQQKAKFIKCKREVMDFTLFSQEVVTDSVEDVITQSEAYLKQKRNFEVALNKLPARQREIMYLRFYESLDLEDIGKSTGIKYQSVINQVHRAVQTLRELYPNADKFRCA